ncbi:MAG: S41 family peptidase, partial [Bacteroidales bacterium]|nr:S41 family peptidase [Bacteroidales bacterium]
LETFVKEETTVGYSRIKNGKEHNAFSDASPIIVSPSENVRYNKHIVLLTDRGTYSAGSMLTSACKALENVTVMGDSTGGGLGLPNGGQLPNGWTYRFSITQTLNLDKSEAWEQGVPPDVEIDINWENRETDEILEKAIYYLNNNV